MSAQAPQAKSWESAGMPGGSRWPIAAGVALALAVLAGAILVSFLHLRKQIFKQIANRDGEILEALAAQQFLDDKANDDSIKTLSDTGEQIQLVFEISQRLQNVIGVRLFSPQGEYVTAAPPRITEGALSAQDLRRLLEGQSLSHFFAQARLAEHDLLADPDAPPVPLLEINFPLLEEKSNRVMGIVQFLMDGSSIAREYAEVNRHLMAQGTLAFVVSGAVVSLGLMLAFRRVQKANTLLAERTHNLLKANRELALAAKTSAIGAVTSHLIHGLRNPLSGLRNFVKERALGDDPAQNTDWQLAVASTQRMQQLIDQVVRVLQEQQIVAEYVVSFAELLEMITSKVEPVARMAGVDFKPMLEADGSLSNRQADLILLILENLLQNAIEATPAGKRVQLWIARSSDKLVMEIEDEGPGLSEAVVEHLFTPCPSTKKGGSGIGLAISRQLAIHLGATLELARTSSRGSCFRLAMSDSEMLSSDGELSGVRGREAESSKQKPALASGQS